MKISELKSLIRELIFEDINKDQLQAVAQFLQFNPDTLRMWVSQVDTTPNKSYANWILRGLKKRDFQIEDQPRVAHAIAEHIRLRTSRMVGDISQFPTLHQLEAAVEQFAGTGSKRQGYSGVDPNTLPGVTVLEQRPDITFFKVTDPNSLAKMGEGTKWCTRYSFQKNTNMAQSYISQQGSIIVGYKSGKPFVQYNPDFSVVMDVNDVNFRGEDAKSLDLPKPDVKVPLTTKSAFRPVNPKDVEKNTPEKILNRWSNYTNNPNFEDPITKEKRPVASGRDENYESRVARSITRSNNHFHLEDVIRNFYYYAKETGERVPSVESALVAKDYAKAMEYKRSHQGKHATIPSMNYIALYAKDVIRGHWPEMEKRLQNDTVNSWVYFKETGLSPDNVENESTKTMILFAQFIKNKHPSVSSAEFEERMRNFMLTARKELRHKAFATTVYQVLIPYMEYSKKTFADIMGEPLTKRLFSKNESLYKYVIQHLTVRDPLIEKQLIAGISNIPSSYLKYKYANNVCQYAKFVIKSPWEEFENALLVQIKSQKSNGENSDTNPLVKTIYVAGRYAHSVRNGKWEEFRSIIPAEWLREQFDTIVERGY